MIIDSQSPTTHAVEDMDEARKARDMAERKLWRDCGKKGHRWHLDLERTGICCLACGCPGKETCEICDHLPEDHSDGVSCDLCNCDLGVE